MLYKFKSQEAADVIMLKLNAEEVLQIIGKPASPTGIITVAQIPAAIQALQAAVAAEDERSKQPAEAIDKDAEDEDGKDVKATVGLKQRAVPFIDMLQRSAAEGADVVWGA